MSEESTLRTEYFANEGALANLLPGYAPREGQIHLAELIETAIQEKSALVAEAGTGIGKTFAYLIPALLSGEKVVVSTGTKNLQDQLFAKDLPLVLNALGLDLQASLLKGRANYVCLHRARQASQKAVSGDHWQDLGRILRWALNTQSGDIAECGEVPESSPVWSHAVSNSSNCLGQDCPDYADCHVVRARRDAMQADVVVINHHVFFADLALKEDGFGELLPNAGVIILDEAHQLPDVATMFFSQYLSARQIQELSRDTVAAFLTEAADMEALRIAAEAMEKAAWDFRLTLGDPGQKAPWQRIRHKPAVDQQFKELSNALDTLHTHLELAAERGRALQNCLKRCAVLLQSSNLLGQVQDNAVQWYETYKRGFILHNTPLEIADTFQQHQSRSKTAWVFTSATLSVAGSFEHFSSRLGMQNAKHAQIDSPFDYPKQALLYLPEGFPQPSDPGYTQLLVDQVVPIIKENNGRAFVLFTSHRALQEAAELFTIYLELPILVQGQFAKRELLKRFKKLGNAVLLGTSSFWEGVDVRGNLLSCVIIDKLPFASPGDPVLQARLDNIRAQGLNPFMHQQVPQAVISLKQGAGRLIRDPQDRGVLVLCDPRLRSKAYGKVFLDSLPPMTQTHDLYEAIAFLKLAHKGKS